MSEKGLKMFDVDAQLDAAFGKEGTSESKCFLYRTNNRRSQKESKHDTSRAC